MGNPYVTETHHHGRVDYGFKLATFGRDLAKALAMPVTVDHEESNYPSVSIDCGDGVSIALRNEYGAKRSKVGVWAGCKGQAKLDHHERPPMPSATIDSGRDMAALARDVTRRVIEPARMAAVETAERVAKKDAITGGLRELAKELERSYPGLQVIHETNKTTADLYFNRPGVGFLHGTLYPNGTCSFQRVSLDGADAPRRLFAILSGGN